jgi:hypothetical protein
MSIHYLYLTTNLLTHEFYVGVRTSKCVPEYDSYLGSGLRLKRAIQKYGRNNFYKRVLRVFSTRAEANRAEIEHVTDAFLSLPGCLNLAPGGQGGNIYERTREINEKIAAAQRGKKKPAVSAARRGKPLSFEHRKAISSAKVGKALSTEHCKNISKAQRGKPKPKLQGRQLSEEQKQRISDAQRGKVMSEATRTKMTHAQLTAWESEERRKAASIKQREVQNRPEVKERLREAIRLSWVRRKVTKSQSVETGESR